MPSSVSFPNAKKAYGNVSYTDTGQQQNMKYVKKNTLIYCNSSCLNCNYNQAETVFWAFNSV